MVEIKALDKDVSSIVLAMLEEKQKMVQQVMECLYFGNIFEFGGHTYGMDSSMNIFIVGVREIYEEGQLVGREHYITRFIQIDELVDVINKHEFTKEERNDMAEFIALNKISNLVKR